MDLQDQFNKLDLQKCLLIGIGIAAIYFVLLYDSGESYLKQMQATQLQITESQATLDKVKKALEDQKKFEEDLKEINTNIKDFQSFFSSPLTTNDLIANVSNFAEYNGVIIEKLVQAKKDTEFPEYPETAVEFTVEGSFHNIMSFISQLTQMKKAIDFSKMEFTTVVGGDFPIIKLSTILVVYGYKEATAGDADGSQDMNAVEGEEGA